MSVVGPRARTDTPIGALLPMMADGETDAVPSSIMERSWASSHRRTSAALVDKALAGIRLHRGDNSTSKNAILSLSAAQHPTARDCHIAEIAARGQITGRKPLATIDAAGAKLSWAVGKQLLGPS